MQINGRLCLVLFTLGESAEAHDALIERQAIDEFEEVATRKGRPVADAGEDPKIGDDVRVIVEYPIEFIASLF